jgi:hypothetical protein
MSEYQHQSPWATIWVKPRATIARIVLENPNRALWVLAGIYGFSSLLNMFQSASLGAALGPLGLLLLAVVLCPIWGFIAFSIWSWLVQITGKLFGGRGSFAAVRCAYAWSCVPFVVNIPLWILMMLLFGRQLFLNFPEGHLLNDGQVALLFFILISKVILAVWSLVIYINALAEVQQYSILRSILNIVLAGVVMMLLLGILWYLALYTLGVPMSQTKTAFLLWNDGLSILRRGQ